MSVKFYNRIMRYIYPVMGAAFARWDIRAL